MLAKSACLMFFLLTTGPLVCLGQEHGWTVSASATDPLVNMTSSTGGLESYYLWFVCADGGTGSFCNAEFSLEYDGPVPISATPMFGFGNAGDATRLFLFGGHTRNPTAVVQLSVLSHSGTISFVPSEGGFLHGVDCAIQVPELFPIEWVGLGIDFPAPEGGTLCQPNPVSVEGTSWGTVKGLYR